MTNKEIIKKFYDSENFSNLEFVDHLFHDKVILEWNSSVGFFSYNKEDMIKFSKELFKNYNNSKVEIKTLFGEGNNVAVRYDYYATTIENPTEMMMIAKIMVIWEFEDGKIIKGFQNSILG